MMKIIFIIKILTIWLFLISNVIATQSKYFEEGIISKSSNQTKSLLSESELTNKYGEAEKDK